MPELKPCPFCGSTTAPTVMNQNEAQWLDNDAENLSMVVCCAAKKFGCGASTGFCDTAEQAIKEWNMRASGWIPCSERLPETHGFYLTYMESLDRFSVFLWTGKVDPSNPEAWNRAGACADCITHWMPIPEPPKEEEE